MTVVRVATAADVPVAEEDLGAPPGVLAALFSRQESGEAVLFLAFDELGAVGSGLLRWAARDEIVREAFPGQPELSNLHVVEPARGQGHGTALVAAIVAHAAGAGHPAIGLGVADDNPGAAGLYLRLGFTETGLSYVDRYTWTDADGIDHDEVEPVRYLVRPLG